MTARLVAPTVAMPDASASPRAAATPTRTPVKLPGPTVTAMRPISENASPASCITSSIIGMSRSAWPLSRTSRAWRISHSPPGPRQRTATDRAPRQVSNARMFMPWAKERD